MHSVMVSKQASDCITSRPFCAYARQLQRQTAAEPPHASNKTSSKTSNEESE